MTKQQLNKRSPRLWRSFPVIGAQAKIDFIVAWSTFFSFGLEVLGLGLGWSICDSHCNRTRACSLVHTAALSYTKSWYTQHIINWSKVLNILTFLSGIAIEYLHWQAQFMHLFSLFMWLIFLCFLVPVESATRIFSCTITNKLRCRSHCVVQGYSHYHCFRYTISPPYRSYLRCTCRR